MKYILLLVLTGFYSVAFAQDSQVPGHNEHNQPPEQDGSTITWEQLTNLDIRVETPAPLQSIFHITFPESLKAKNGKNVTIKGFMYPLEAGETHDYFLLSAVPPSCPFCLPGGAMTLIEVKCAEPVEYTMEAVSIQGKFALSKDDPSGLYYRLTEARSATN